jgi:hypothetical protein
VTLLFLLAFLLGFSAVYFSQSLQQSGLGSHSLTLTCIKGGGQS